MVLLQQYYMLLMIFLFLLGCGNQETSVASEKIAKKGSSNNTSIAILYTGELLGELEPCGCSGSKLGGMLLRSSWTQELKKQYPHLVLADGGFSAPHWELQDQMKSKVYQRCLQKIGYHLRFVHQQEKIPNDLVADPILIGWGQKDKTWFRLQTVGNAPHTLKILWLSFEKEIKTSTEQVTKILAESQPQIVIGMTKGIFESYQTLIPTGNYLTFIWPVDAQAPFSPYSVGPKIWVMSAGNRGRYAGLLMFQPLNQEWTWESRTVALEKKWEPMPEVVQLLDQYKQELQDKKLLEFQIKRSSPIGFVGSDGCQSCHEYEYNEWKKKPHSQAFATLVKEKHHYDPECVGCHTVGFEFEEGFRTEEETPYLIDVGCESCHGAGAQHVMVPNTSYGKTDEANTCLVCHEKDRSPHFEYATFLEKIKHWRDQK